MHLPLPYFRRALQAILAITLATTGIHACPYTSGGMEIDWTQPDGTKLSLRVFGDLFYARTETLDGYTVVYNPATKAYEYAKTSPNGKKLVPSGVKANGKVPPGLAKRLDLAVDSRRAIWKERYEKLAPNERENWTKRVKAARQRKGLEPAEAGPQNGPGGSGSSQSSSPEFAPVTGAYVGLTILVQFPDDPATTPAVDPTDFPTTQANMVNFCNQIGYTGGGNSGSVRDYFLAQSLNQTDYTQVVTAIVTLPQPRAYYNWSDYPTNATLRDGGLTGRLVLGDAITILKAQNFDFTGLTRDGSNRVVATNVLFAGATSGVWPDGLWPHRWSIPQINCGTVANPIYIYDYQITNAQTASVPIGTFCHENGHLLLKYPDLYDYGNDGLSRGVGNHCLMGGGNHLNGGKTPGPINGYFKDVVGWSNVVDITTSDFLTDALPTTNNEGYRIRKPGTATEYFLIENRGTGDPWAQYVPDKGILIWHIDETVNGNENQHMTAAKHYEVSLEQADGAFDLEMNRDGGDSTDAYDSTFPNFTDSTLPDAKWWNGSNSGIQISVQSAAGASMNVRFGLPANTVAVNFPNGGESIYLGSTQTITWGANITGNVKIDLFKGGVLHSALSANEANDGAYSWVVSAGLPSGSDYTVRITSVDNPAYLDSSNANFSIIPQPTIADALDTTGITWSTSGNANWFAQGTTTHDGIDAAESGNIADSQSSTMEATITGPGNMTFWWKVSSESGYDYLRFFLNNVEQTGSLAKIAGEVDWVQKTVAIPAGSQTIKWTYSKDGSVDSGADTAWVDQVVYTPSTAPEIAVEQPVGTGLTDGTASISCGTVNLGSSSSPVAFTVRNTGTANLTGLALTKSGTHNADFTLGSLGATTLAPGDSTTFDVTFTPGAAGARTAAIQLASNDTDENPFDVSLTGTGVGPGTLAVGPAGNLTSSGNFGGPFSPSSLIYTLSNPGYSSIDWTATKTTAWVTLSSSGGTLAPGGNTTVTVSLDANTQAVGGYSDTVSFTNTTNGSGDTSRGVSLTVNPIPATFNFSNLTQTYDGTQKSATITTTPPGLAYTVTYGGSSTEPTNANTYAIATTITEPNYSGTGSSSLTISKASQTINFAALDPVFDNATPFALTATASSNLPVSYNSSNPLVATVSGNTITIAGLGTSTITALQAGDTNYNAATSVPQTLTVVRSNPLAVAGGPYKVLIGQSLSLNGSASLPSYLETITTHEWDLNNDNTFGDTTGANPAAIPFATLTSSWGMVQGLNTIQLKVTDSANKTSIVSTTVELVLSLTWDSNGTTAGQTNGAGAWLGANLWWDGSGNQTWSSGSNATFGGPSTAGGAVTLANPTVVNSLTFNSYITTGYTLGTAGQTITLNSGITKNAGGVAATIISPVTLGGAQTWTNNSTGLLSATGGLNNGGFLLAIGGTGNTTFTGVAGNIISGAGGLTKNGSGVLELGGAGTPQAHTFGGVTTINGGVVRIGGNLPATTALTINDGVLETYFGGSFTRSLGSGTGQIQILGGASGFSGQGANATTYTIGTSLSTLQWGSAFFNPATLVLQAATANADGKMTLANGIDFNGTSRTIAVNGSTTTTGTNGATITGVLSNSTGTAGFTKSGVGQLLLTNAASTYTGPTIIIGGVLNATTFAAINTNSSIGKGSVGGSAVDLVLNGGTLRHDAANVASTNRLFSVGTNGGGIDSSAASTTNILSFTGTGAMGFNSQTGTRTLTLTGSNTGNNTLALLIGDDGTNATGLTKSGTGTWILSNTGNSYTGATTLAGGVLQGYIPGGIGASGGTSALILNGGVLALTAGDFTRPLGSNTTVAAVNFTGAGGWAAYGADRNVNLGGALAQIAWGTANTGFNGQTLILGAGTATHKVTLQNGLDLGTAVRTVQTDDGAGAVDGELSGVITGGAGGGLTKTGTGVLSLSNANTYIGVTTVNAGVLRLDHATALPGGIAATGGTSNLTFNGGVVGLATGDFTRSLNTAATATATTFTGAGGWAAYGANRVVNLGGASATISWATANTGFNGQALTLGATTATHMVDLQNPLNLGSAARTVTVNDGSAAIDAKLSGDISGTAGLTKAGTGSLWISGNISNSAGGLTIGANGTLTLSGTNTYSGNTNFNASSPTLVFAGMQAVSPNTTIVTNINASTAASTIYLLDDTSNANNSTVSVPNTFTIQNNNGPGNAHAFFVGNNNTANGGTSSGTTTGSTIAFGTINWNTMAAGTTAYGPIQIQGTNGYRLQINSMVLHNAANLTSPTVGSTVFSPTSANVTLGTATVGTGNTGQGYQTLVLDGTSSDNRVTGAISNASDVGISNRPLSVTKSNTSIWTFSGSNSYTGATTVSGGKLFINGDQTSATGAVTVAASATLGGTGTIGGNTTLATGGRLEFNLSTNVASHDKLELATGRALAFGTTCTLTITSGGGAASGSYPLITAPGGIGTLPTFTLSLPLGWAATVSKVGNDLVLNVTLPDTTPPALTSISDDQSGAPVVTNTLVTYTVSFSEDINHTSVSAADFGNAGTASGNIGAVVETTPGVFTVPVTPTSVGTLQLQVNAGAVLTDLAGNALVTSSAIADDTIITVTPSNTAPVANAQSTGTAEDTALPITLTATDGESNPLTYSVISGPSNGTLGGSPPNLIYTPAANFNGSDSFTFKANDGSLDSAPATVDITVTPINDAPVATAQSVSTAEDTALPITLAGTDVENSTLTFAVVTPPANGTLSGTAPNLTYTPTANSNGPDSFTFTVNDGQLDSAPVNVVITVTQVNDAPVAVAQSATTAEDTALPITLAGTDVDLDTLNYTIVAQPANGTLSGTAPNVTYTPTANTSGADSFTFKVNDGTVDSTIATVSLTVTAANDAPVATAQSVTTAEDTALPITLTGTDVENSTLSYTIVTAPTNGTLSGTAPDLTYTPAANYNGADSFTFTVNDGTDDSAVATVSITVTPVNDAPVAVVQNATTAEDTVLPITLAGTDVDLDTLTYAIVTPPTSGTLSGTAPNVTYTPSANYNGPDTFTFTVNDGTVDSALATVSLTVTAANDAPVATAQNVTTAEDTALPITLTGTDAENETLTFTIVTPPASGTLSGTAPNMAYTPAADFNGAASFTFKANDGTEDSAVATISINVTPSNDAPIAVAQSATTTEDTALPITLAGTDVDLDTLSYTIVTPPANGTLSGTAPNVTYTPNANTSGSDSFTFTVNDGTVDSALATVSLTVTATNDAPIATAQSVTTAEDATLPITLAGTDVENSTLTFTVVTPPANGTLSGTAPNLNYTPSANYNGSDSFTFIVNDGTVDSAPATITLTVTAINDAPVATAQSVSTAEDAALPITLAGTDVENSTLTFAIVTPPANGTLSGTAPNLTYTPSANYNGPDSFTFTVNDGTVDSALATITLTVTASNDTPVATAQSVTTAEDTALPITLAGTDVENSTLTYTLVTPPVNGALSGTAPNVTYTPASNSNGTDSFTFIVNDGSLDSVAATVDITVTPINDAPVATAQSATTAEDTALPITLAGSDVENSTLSYTIVTPPANGSLSGTAPNLTYTPAANFSGPDSFTFIVNDGSLDSASATVTLTVTATNDTPVAVAQSFTTAEDTALPITLTGTDAENSTLTYSIVAQPASGTLSGTAPNVTYTPAANYNGAASFTFKVNDGTLDSATATVSINVTSVNDAPFFTIDPIVAAGATESIAYTGQTIAGSATDTDAGDSITYSKVSGPAWLSVASNGTLSGTPGSGTAGLNAFIVRATDTASGVTDAALQITVTGLPLPWASGDIGTGMLAGTTTFSSGTFTQAGSGIIGSTADKLRFTYQTLTGDGEIIARVSNLQNTGNSSRVGVMIRDTLATNSKQIFMGLTGSGAYRWARRTATGGSTTSTNSSSGTVPNTWVRLVRSGTTITAYKSTNGTTWTTVGSTTGTTFASTCYIGLAVSSGSDTTLNTSQFGNISVTP